MDESEEQPSGEGSSPEIPDSSPLESQEKESQSENPLFGTILGDYEIESELGRGGMGVVYRARQISLDRPVAMKVLSSELGADEEFVNRFLREARAAARLNHPNVIQVFDAGVHEDIYFFVMELAQGQDLAQLLRDRKRFKERDALVMVQEAAKGLAFAHQQGIVHRDIKPANLMLIEGKVIKIGDLGLAKWKSHESDNSLTAAGVTMGTPYYISPEQIRSLEDIDGRSDIYALGMTLYHFLVGKPPFCKGSSAEIMAQHLSEPVGWETLRSEASEKTCELVAAMVEKDREKRVPEMQTVVQWIGSILGQTDESFGRSKKKEGEAKKKENFFTRSAPSWVTSLFYLTVVVLIGVLVWSKFRGSKDPESAAIVETPSISETQPPTEQIPHPTVMQEEEPVKHAIVKTLPLKKVVPTSKTSPSEESSPRVAEKREPSRPKSENSPKETPKTTPQMVQAQPPPTIDNLFGAVSKGTVEDVAAILSYGIDVSSINDKKQSALMFAAALGRTEMINFLIDKKISLNLQDLHGMTAVAYAADKGQSEALAALLAGGADPNLKNIDGQTALMRAAFDGKLEPVNELLKRRAALDEQDNNGMSALMYASYNGHAEVVKAIIASKPNLNQKEKKEGDTPLLLATKNRHLEVIRALVDAKVNINQGNNMGRTPLMYAAWQGNKEVVEFLLQKGANKSSVAKDGGTPLKAAGFSGHFEIVEILKKAGARPKSGERF
jgi:serine/threonine protein kinase